jgi:hypothetical protein
MDPITTILGAVNLAGNIGQGIYNYFNQKEQQNYERKMNQTMMDREDTAIQRRVADLKAAGLSPVLAAGQGASTNPIKATTTPEFRMNQNLGALNTRMQLKKNEADVSQTKAQTALTNQQTKLLEDQRQESSNGISVSKAKYKQELRIAQLQAEYLERSMDQRLSANEKENLTRDLLNKIREKDLTYYELNALIGAAGKLSPVLGGVSRFLRYLK